MADANQIVIALFGVVPGGFKSAVESVIQKDADVGMVSQFLGMLSLSDAALGHVLAENLMGDTVSPELKSAVENILAGGLSSSPDKAAFVTSVIDIVASWSPDDPVFGATALQFQNRQAVADFHHQHGGDDEFDLGALAGLLRDTGTLMQSAAGQMLEIGEQAVGDGISSTEPLHVRPAQGNGALSAGQLEFIAALQLAHQYSLDYGNKEAGIVTDVADGVQWKINATLGGVDVADIVFHLSKDQYAEATQGDSFLAVRNDLMALNSNFMSRYWTGQNDSYQIAAQQFSEVYGPFVFDDQLLPPELDLLNTSIRGEFHSAVSVVGLSQYLDVLENDSASWTVI